MQSIKRMYKMLNLFLSNEGKHGLTTKTIWSWLKGNFEK